MIMAVESEDHHGHNVTKNTREGVERREARGSINGTVGTKVGSNLPQKIFVAPKVFKNC